MTQNILAWIVGQIRASGTLQIDLADGLGCSQALVSRLLSGEIHLRMDVYLQLADIIGFCPEEGLQNRHHAAQ